MDKLRQTAEMALKYFEDAHGLEDAEVAIKEALRQALAEPEYQYEVVAMHENGTRTIKQTLIKKREWVGLTDGEKYDVLEGATGDGGRVYYDTLFRSYEAKLREKNA